MTTPAPTRPAPSRTPPARSAPSTPATSPKKFTIDSGARQQGQRVIIHGPPGVGKTTLASLIQAVRFIDKDSDGTAGLDVSRVKGIETFDDGLVALGTPELWAGIETIAVDSASVFQELGIQQVVGKPKDGEPARSIETAAGGYGKGYRLVYDLMVKLMAALDRHIEQGRNVVLICHTTEGKVPNPAGEDFLQSRIDLIDNKQGPIRGRVEGWADHILFIARDVAVSGGKGSSKGTRAIQTQWSPWWTAKSRALVVNGERVSLPAEVMYPDPKRDPDGAAEIWRLMGFNK